MNTNENDLLEQLTKVEWLLHRYHQQNHRHYGPMGDPRKGQGRILSILKMKPEISQKELSFLLEMRPQSLGELLTKLEKKGLIERSPSEEDRRLLIIKLTDEGKEATAETGDDEFSFDKVFECLNEEEQGNFSDYLGRIIKVLEAEVGQDEMQSGFGRHGGPDSRRHFGGDPRRNGGDPRHHGGDPRMGGGPFGGGNDPRLKRHFNRF